MKSPFSTCRSFSQRILYLLRFLFFRNSEAALVTGRRFSRKTEELFGSSYPGFSARWFFSEATTERIYRRSFRHCRVPLPPARHRLRRLLRTLDHNDMRQLVTGYLTHKHTHIHTLHKIRDNASSIYFRPDNHDYNYR